MRYLLLITLFVLYLLVNGKKKKLECEWSDRPGVFLKTYDRKTKAYPSVEKAKEACEKDSGCGAVGVDLVPYKKRLAGPVVHEQTIYLLQGSELMLQAGEYNNPRFRSFVKGECKKRKRSEKGKKRKKQKRKKGRRIDKLY
ncbi:hypothetical protein ACHWQZ_G005889 [Mnemiopsis leidyi]